MNNKTVVLLTNLGGAGSVQDVEEFLLSLLSDPYVIRLPLLMRPAQGLLAKRIVSKYLPKSQKLYKEIGGGSPIIKISNILAQKLSKQINKPVFAVMRHGKNNIYDCLEELKELQPEKIIVLPLFPQYSTTTTLSSFKQLEDVCQKHLPESQLQFIHSYADHKSFIKTWVYILERRLRHEDNPQDIEFIFSAHGIPVDYIKKYGDPYLEECQASVQSIMKHFPDNKYQLTFQSKFGKGEWLKPATKDYIKGLAETNKKRILVIPISFVSEHIETIHEIGIQFREITDSLGIDLLRVPTPNTLPIFINALEDILIDNEVN